MVNDKKLPLDLYFLEKYARTFNVDISDITEIQTSEGACKGFIVVNNNDETVKYFWHEDSKTVLEEIDGDVKEASYIN